jgi:hypothetical protein
MNNSLTTLSVRNLSSSLENLQENILKEKAKEVVQYQNFRTAVALEKMQYMKDRQTFNMAVGYVKYGTRHPNIISKAFKAALDECIKNHVQPLTPKQDEVRQKRGCGGQNLKKHYQKKDAVVPIATLEVVNEKLTETFEYGVMQGNNIRIFNSEEEARQFRDNLVFFSAKEIKLVEVKYNEVK